MRRRRGETEKSGMLKTLEHAVSAGASPLPASIGLHPFQAHKPWDWVFKELVKETDVWALQL